jgi:RNA polymerase sigma-70 factor (ECF subfamily)
MGLPAEKNARVALTLVQGTGTGNAAKTDAELVVAAQNKDSHAFEMLVRRHQRAVYNLLYQLAPDWNNTSDLAQEVFIRAWKSIHNLRNPRAFKSWLNQIATNLFYDELRRRPKHMNVISMDEGFESDEHDEGPTRDIADTSALPDECFQRQELAEAIRRAMGELPEQFRVAIVLRELQGLSYEEIALLTQSEMGTVKSRIARARTKIQQLLEPYLTTAA